MFSTCAQNRLIPLPVLFAVDHNSPYYHEENKGSIFYAESWALVHYLEITSQQTIRTASAPTQSCSSRSRIRSPPPPPHSAISASCRESSNVHPREQLSLLPHAQPASSRCGVVRNLDRFRNRRRCRRADFLAYNGRTAEAHTLLDAVLKQDPNNAVACETLGYMALQTHDMEGARKWLTQAVKLDSHSYLAHYYYAAMAMSEDGLKNARAIEASLKTAIKLNPAFAPSYDRLASLYHMQNEHLEDAHMLELQAMELDPANIFYRINTAHLLAALQRDNDALRVLDTARPFAQNSSQTAIIDEAARQMNRTERSAP